MEQRPFQGTSGPGSLPRFDRRHAPRSGSYRETRSAKGGVANDPLEPDAHSIHQAERSGPLMTREMTRSTEIGPAPRVSRKRRIDVQTRCSGQACGYTKSWIVRMIPRSGSVASRVAKPTINRSEHPTSN